MAGSFESTVAELTKKYPRFILDGKPYRYQYGTAGFRDVAERLPSAMVRVGILAALESKCFGGKVVGVVVTASHNQGSDNGAKIMDYQGEMISHLWEEFASVLANADEGEGVVKAVKDFAASQGIDFASPSTVFVGRDTRESSPYLQDCVIKGASALGSCVFDHGQVTTPQLHWVVRAFNEDSKRFSPLSESTRDDLQVYNKNLSESIGELLDGPVEELTVDCANGIGAVALEKLKPFISKFIPLRLMNASVKDFAKLNHNVGAEHVQKNRKLPEGVDPSKDQSRRFASIDGDADRVVFFYVDSNQQLCLLDGDKIIALVATYFKQLVDMAQLDLKIGIVQTAYANGASTIYLSKVLKVPVACVPTGVKFLHHKAAEFDIGIYFEANGHGTAIFSPSAISKIVAVSQQSSSPTVKKAANRLLAFSRLINQAVGDAISDILLVEVTLASLKLTMPAWNSFYADFPSHQSKVKVKDRSVVITTDAERRVQSPSKLQEAIDAAVSKFQLGRAFVRPSGTEDVIRTYAEAATEAEAKQLGEMVGKAVFDYAGGV
uniref:Phosphoacetylglucosamine mutase n=1 Tax=Spongospora subterranea TaxID=70186 RepID=A0A0H5R877_9EUKA|eukprot:CRZ09912.1 hypothetical protein [Spongospora subterranea]